MSIERSKETHVPVGGPSNNREGSYRKIKTCWLPTLYLRSLGFGTT